MAAITAIGSPMVLCSITAATAAVGFELVATGHAVFATASRPLAYFPYLDLVDLDQHP